MPYFFFFHLFIRSIFDIVESHILQSDVTIIMPGLAMEVAFVGGPFGEFEIDVGILCLDLLCLTDGRSEDGNIGWTIS